MKVSVGQMWIDSKGRKFVITSAIGNRFSGIREDGKIFDTGDFMTSDDSVVFGLITRSVLFCVKSLPEAMAMLFSKKAEV